MDDLLTRFWPDLVERMTGPLSFRFVLQPVMASIIAMRDGLDDAKHGRPPYLWTLLTSDGERRRLVSEAWHAVFRVILLGTIMDIAYQVMVFRGLRPLELVFVVLALAFVPYIVLRGPVNRLARHWLHDRGLPRDEQSAATLATNARGRAVRCRGPNPPGLADGD